ncbi:MAG: hypothetical protein KBD24_04285 [Candidatus Pacebacteria bacterium]|nr:hypothetical protein [Candidatus Paceibacterota bacterium]
MSYIHTQRTRAFTLLEVILGISVMLLIFGALFESFNILTKFGERNRLHTEAVFLVNEHMEMIRALPYDSIGTLLGLPSGTIPQLETVVHNGHSYTRRTFIQYIDDPADGTGGADTLATDYKRIKIEISYSHRNATNTISVVSTVAPKAKESLAGAGILTLNVVDSQNQPIHNATVHVQNYSIATSVDITTFTNPSGVVSLPGAWTGTGYEIVVSKAGYSTARTYTMDGVNVAPDPSPLTVADSSTTEVYFQIDELTDVHLIARDQPVTLIERDLLDDVSGLTNLTQTTVTGGALTLTTDAGGYLSTGSAYSTPITPTTLAEWGLFVANDERPSTDTTILYRFEYDTGSGVFAPIPDSDLPNNAVGFSDTPVALSGLSTSTYHTIRVHTTLATANPAQTPRILSWTTSYRHPDTIRASTDVLVTSTKTIGDDAGGQVIPKYEDLHTTDSVGEVLIPDMEFDDYSISHSSLEIVEACPPLPLSVPAGTTLDATLTLVTPTTHSYTVTVVDPVGAAIPSAEVTLTRAGTSITHTTTPCGMTYVGGLVADTYQVMANAPGFAPYVGTRVISGHVHDSITMTN